MPTFELTPMMMREIIMDHYSSPRHKADPIQDGYVSVHAESTNCIDDFHVYLKEKDGVVEDALWNGVACTISTASTDILCDQVIGKSFKESKYMIKQFLNMIEEKEYDESVLDEAIVFINTGKQAARIHCATMGWTAMKDLMEDKQDGRHQVLG